MKARESTRCACNERCGECGRYPCGYDKCRCGSPSWRLIERWAERRMARRYWHQTPWRSCNQSSRGLCLRCFLRDITGTNRRARAAHVKYVHEVVMPQLTPIKRPRVKR